MKNLFFILLLSVVLLSCDQPESMNFMPMVITKEITSATLATTVLSTGGSVNYYDNEGGLPITAYGVCWDTLPSPTVSGIHTIDGEGTGTYTSIIPDLTPSTTYYVRAYATNSAGTEYGNEITFTTSSNVYVVGYEQPSGGFPIAKTWINGVEELGKYSVDRGINQSVYVSGTDVYITGWSFSSTSPTFVPAAIVYKNGVRSYLNDCMGCYSTGKSVYVVDKDVYVAGYFRRCPTRSPCTVGESAILWGGTTGTGFDNTISVNDKNSAESVYVSGKDVYVAGYRSSGSKYVAMVSKNGVATTLTDGSNDAYAQSVYVAGTDVYVAGYEVIGSKKVAKIWKNGTATSLTNGSADGMARSVYVSAGDVYVVGNENNVAKIWKNGVATAFTDGTTNADAYSICVSGKDVYVAGVSNSKATVWKNGVAFTLTKNTNSGVAYSVFVK